MYANILVPIDGSATANRGLAEAIRLAKTLGSRICVVHVITESLGAPPNARAVELENLIEAMRRNGQTLLAHASERVLLERVVVISRLLEAWGGSAGERIVEFAKEWRPDLIVCGTHGRSGIDRFLMGSNAEHIVRHSPAPVLLVKDRAANDGT